MLLGNLSCKMHTCHLEKVVRFLLLLQVYRASGRS